MTQKLLISTDRNGIAEFQRAVQGTAEAANQLIQVYEAFQPWEKVTSLDQFTELVSDPKKYFDDTIVVNVHVTARGLTVDPEQAARLFNISRDLYNNAVSGMPLVMDDCPECQRAKVKPGKRAISKHEFSAYREYLIFSAGRFSVDQSKIDADLDKFSTYAESEEELSLYTLHHDLVNILNEYTSLYPISSTDRLAIKGALKLHLTNGGDGLFMVNTETLKNAINKLKYTNHGN